MGGIVTRGLGDAAGPVAGGFGAGFMSSGPQTVPCRITERRDRNRDPEFKPIAEARARILFAGNAFDPTFTMGLFHRVTVEFDTNNAGATRGAHAGVNPSWRAVNMPPNPVVLDRRYRLLAVDPMTGAAMRWYVEGKARPSYDFTGAIHHWAVDVIDRYL